MTKRQLINKIEHVQDLIEALQDDILELQSHCETKMTNIDDKVSNRDSGEMTEFEENRYENYQDLIDYLDALKDDFDTCIFSDAIDELEKRSL